MRLITDLFAYCRREVPRWNTISISGYHMREAGSTAVQEVAFTLANAIAYVEAARAAGLAVDDFAPQLSFFFNAHNDLAGGGREVPRRAHAVGAADARPLRGPRPALAHAALSRPDRGQHAHRPAAREQHRAGDRAGAGRRARRLPVAAHQLDGRGPGPADRASRAHRPAHPADPRPRVGGGGDGRSAGRVVRGGAAHPGHRGGGRRLHRARSTSWAGRWRPSPSCSGRSTTRPTATSARSRSERGSWWA